MRRVLVIAAAAALGTLSACNLLGIQTGGGEADTGTRNSLAASDSGNDPEPKAKDDRPSREPRDEEPTTRNDSASDDRAARASSDTGWILGRWGEAGCAQVIEFFPNGDFVLNGNSGQWSIEGDTLTLAANGQEQIFSIARESGGLTVTDGEGNVEEFGRC